VFRKITFHIVAALALAGAAMHSGAVEPNAQICISVASLRAEPAHSSELETQALCGTPLWVDTLSDDPDWMPAILPDGYRAYVHRSAVALKSAEDMCKWRESERIIVKSINEIRLIADTLRPESAVSDLTLGSILTGRINHCGNYTAVEMPDGRRGYLLTNYIDDFKRRMADELKIDRVLDVISSLRGVPYLWGGNSTKALDCSGLIWLSLLDGGILSPRNASAQGECGSEIQLSNVQPGDLLFFRNEHGRVTHVGISCGGTHYFHSSGMVHESSFSDSDPMYNGRIVSFVKRIDWTGKTTGMKRIIENPWYF